MTRIPSDCLSRECIEERIKRRQTATIVYQYRSAYRRRDCILYPPLSPLNDRGIIPELIDEHHCRVRSAIPLSFRREVSSALLESRLVFATSARALARISLNSISFYRRSTSERSSRDPALIGRRRRACACVLYPSRRLYISSRVYPRRCGLRQDVSTLVEAGHVGARAAIVAGALTLRGCNEQDDLSKPLSFLRRYLAFRVTRKESRTINLSSRTGMSFGQRKTHTPHDESLWDLASNLPSHFMYNPLYISILIINCE